jgi:hypothetical protein
LGAHLQSASYRPGLGANDELLARHGHHLGPDLHREITEGIDALHLQGLDDKRREFGDLGEAERDLLDQLLGGFKSLS